MDMTWKCLILLSLSKKWPINWFPDTRGVGHWWLCQCTVGPAAFWKCVFLGHPVYLGSYSSWNYCSGGPDLAKEWLGRQKDRCPGGEKGKQSKLHQTLLVYILKEWAVSPWRSNASPWWQLSGGWVCRARRGEGGKKRRKVSSYLALNGIVLT